MIPSNHVRVWTWRYARDNAAHPEDLATLSAFERARAERFVFAVDRARFVAAHAALRRILGELLGRAPDSLVFELGPFGKPHLAGSDRPPLFFNLSHSGGWAGVAVSASFEVGFDIERIRPAALDGVMAALTQEELAELARLPPGARTRAAFHAWTRKEAFVKASGVGLSTALDSFSVTLASDVRPHIRRVAGDPQEAARWQLMTMIPAPGYVGAVAARALGWSMRVHRIEQETATPQSRAAATEIVLARTRF